MRLLLLAPLLCGGVRVVERRRLLGTAAAAWPAAAGAAPAWLADVPTESASGARAAAAARGARAPAASSRESDRRAQRSAFAASPASRAVTATLRLSVRVARADGTFSVRDDDPDPPVFGDLDLGLWRRWRRRAPYYFAGFFFGRWGRLSRRFRARRRWIGGSHECLADCEVLTKESRCRKKRNCVYKKGACRFKKACAYKISHGKCKKA
ncbi:hypothetical protein JL720_12577 [Aureococcus anophagefferens]|nr:hypothetical protein JL720_12577 [Aureococcus anophagefferens]